MSSILEYPRLSITELADLDRETTVFLLALSPLEAHGPHLSVGIDVFVAEEMQRRYIAALEKEFPHLTLVTLPSLYLGSDVLPYNGSLPVPAPHLRGVLFAYARGLASQGFKYLFLSDNHGGPRHHLAVETAAQKAYKKYGFHIVFPFGLVYRQMVENDPELLRETGLCAGTCGDDPDNHAGTNETSLALAVDPGLIRQDYQDVPKALPPAPSKPVMLVSRLAGIFSSKARVELVHLANLMGWVSSPDMLPYLGDPSIATQEAGEAMLEARVKIGMELFRRSLKGEQVKTYPLLWFLRILQHLPE